MVELMKNKLINEILRFALTRKKLSQKAAYLFKGLLFTPFLIKKGAKMTTRDETVSATSQAGDDIYPLF